MKRIGAAAILLLVFSSASADNGDAEWRVGGSLAFSDYKRDDNSVDNNGMGLELFAQYRFNSWVGVEGSYYVSPEFEGDATPTVAGGETETTYQGVALNGIGYLPIRAERLDLFVKAGYFNFFDVNIKTDGVVSDTSSDDGLALGAGFSVRATEQIGFRVELDWYDVTGAELWTADIGIE
ncbi:MAG: porin family protein, partial [Gammaproteobacteria bacterium]